MEAWQKLIRVLTHEIMNSVAPITSLSSTMKHIVQQGDLEGEKRASLEEGLDAIEAPKSRFDEFLLKLIEHLLESLYQILRK